MPEVALEGAARSVGLDAKLVALRAGSVSWARWSSRSRAAPTRRCSPGWRHRRRSGPDALRGSHGRVAVARRRRSWTTAGRWRAEWGLRWSTVETDELANAAYRANDGDRCFWCKDGADGRASARWPTAREPRSCSASTSTTSATIGPASRRPRDAGRGVPDGRRRTHQGGGADLSRRLGLRTWDKPAAACLASRVPYGTTGDARRAVDGRTGRGRTAPTRVRRPARPALRATSPASRCRSTARPTSSPTAPMSWRRSAPPATAT